MLQISNFTLDTLDRIIFGGEQFAVDDATMRGIGDCHDFLKNFAANKIIYGINTGFGPMAQWRVDDQFLSDLQYNIIRSHSTGAGEPLEDMYVRTGYL